MRRSLKAVTVVLYSGGMESVWVAAGRKREKGEKRLAHGRKCGRMCERWKWQRDMREE